MHALGMIAVDMCNLFSCLQKNCALLSQTRFCLPFEHPTLDYYVLVSINQSINKVSNQIKKFDIQCTLYNIHGKLFYNKHVTTFSLSD